MSRAVTIIDTDCDAEKAYNFNINNRALLGYIEKMSFTSSGKTLKADTPVSDPESPDSQIKVVAVLDHIKWDGGPTDPIEFEGRLSPDNRGSLLECVASLTGGSDVEASWVIKSYDHPQKKYYKRFHTDGKDIKLVLTEGAQVLVNETSDPFVKQPVNFRFKMSLTPKSEGGDQTLCCATSADQKFTKQVGISVG